MKDFVPLFVQWTWILLVLVLALVFRNELRLLREALVSRLKKGGSIEFGSFKLGELRKELEEVRSSLDETSDLASELFLTTMSPMMYMNLKKLDSGSFGHYEITQGLIRELYHLRTIGYIVVESIGAIPDQGADLSEHVQITPTGKRFVQLRETVLARSTTPGNTVANSSV